MHYIYLEPAQALQYSVLYPNGGLILRNYHVEGMQMESRGFILPVPDRLSTRVVVIMRSSRRSW